MQDFVALVVCALLLAFGFVLLFRQDRRLSAKLKHWKRFLFDAYSKTFLGMHCIRLFINGKEIGVVTKMRVEPRPVKEVEWNRRHRYAYVTQPPSVEMTVVYYHPEVLEHAIRTSAP